MVLFTLMVLPLLVILLLIPVVIRAFFIDWRIGLVALLLFIAVGASLSYREVEERLGGLLWENPRASFAVVFILSAVVVLFLIKWRIGLIPLLAVMAAGAMVLVIVARGPESRSDYAEVIAQVKSGKLIPGPDGVLTLPRNLASAGLYGVAYVTKKPSGEILILFPFWRGKGRNLMGYLYSSVPLTKDHMPQAGGSGYITVNGPLRRSERVLVERKINPNWYYVKRSLD